MVITRIGPLSCAKIAGTQRNQRHQGADDKTQDCVAGLVGGVEIELDKSVL